jgi:hypothetical protein
MPTNCRRLWHNYKQIWRQTLSREATFMQRRQQILVDERGGTSGHNFNNLMLATHRAHAGTNPEYRTYNVLRTARGSVLGAIAIESLCQDALIQHGTAALPDIILKDIEEIFSVVTPASFYRIPAPYHALVNDYSGALQARAGQDIAPPDVRSRGFGFYNAALAKLHAPYMKARLVTEDWGGESPEWLSAGFEESQDFVYAITEGFSDNVAACLDVLVAMGVGLCIAKGRACGADEISEFVAENSDAAIVPASATRKLRNGPQAALPYGYGMSILRGDEAMIGKQCVRAIKEDGKYRAQWVHPTLNRGNRAHPGHCPASAYNRLRPRTGEELTAAKASLAQVGLEGVIVHDTVNSAHLVLGRALPVAQTTTFADTEWQERVLHAARNA